MKRNLPKSHSETAVPATLPQKRRLVDFPNIYRFITERQFIEKSLSISKVLIISVVSGLLLAQIILRSMTLLHNLEEEKRITNVRAQINGEVNYWKKVAKEYKNYRDAYYQIAVLEYKLGNIDDSKKYVKKALELDPNFKSGNVLGEKVGL